MVIKWNRVALNSTATLIAQLSPKSACTALSPLSPDNIRQLTAADIPALITLSTLAGWNQTPEDWLLLIQLHPEGCLGIERDGRIVAATTLIIHGHRLGWIGMVLTHPDYRGQGFATLLVTSALDIASAVGVGTLKLDATDQGEPIYQKLGFRREQLIERWAGQGTTAHRSPALDSSGKLELELDREAFGTDRSQLLQHLSSRSLPVATADGFAFWRLGANASYLGPCVARSPESAKLLIGEALGENEGEWFWDLLPANPAAVELAGHFGFRPARKLVRMVKGNDMRGNDSMLYAAAGFEIG